MILFWLMKQVNSCKSLKFGSQLCINADKRKCMKIGPPEATWQLKVNRQLVECDNEFCYIGSITNTGSCDKEVKTCISKANSAFKRLDSIWHQKHLGLPIRIRLYESLCWLYCCTVPKQPVTAKRKRLEGFHHNCLRRILNISWKDKVKNDSVRRKTNQSLLECTLQTTRLKMVWSCAACAVTVT